MDVSSELCVRGALIFGEIALCTLLIESLLSPTEGLDIFWGVGINAFIFVSNKNMNLRQSSQV
jgi:hypothetical protein